MMAEGKQEQNTQSEQVYYTIEQIAQRTGLTKRTLRYYEEVGLLLPMDRTEGNYRRYSENDIRLLERIKELRDLLGFSLSDIRTILEAEEERGQIKLAYTRETDAAAKLAQLERSDELIRGQIQLIDQKIDGLVQMRSSLQARLERHKQRRNEIYKSNT